MQNAGWKRGRRRRRGSILRNGKDTGGENQRGDKRDDKRKFHDLIKVVETMNAGGSAAGYDTSSRYICDYESPDSSTGILI